MKTKREFTVKGKESFSEKISREEAIELLKDRRVKNFEIIPLDKHIWVVQINFKGNEVRE